MKRFQVSTTLQGEPVTLTVEAMNAPIGSEHLFFKVRKERKWLAVIKMNGECNLVSTGKKQFNDQDVKRLCKEIFTYLKRNDADLSIIYL